MKNIKSIFAIILLLCLCITGCSSNESSVNSDDYSDAIGDSPESAVSPSETYIINCLKESELVLNIEAATESNDPNGKLNQKGGYTSCVFFSSTLVDQSEFSEESVLENGTSCGGSIEVYSTETDASARNDYLSKFDGGLLDSGSHTVIGTIIIRTSSKLSKDLQVKLTRNLIMLITSSNHSEPTNDQQIDETVSISNETPPTVSNESIESSTNPTTESTTKPPTTPTTESTTKPATEPTTHVHSFSAATCTSPKTCSCGATEGNANGHKWKEATCTSPKTCTICEKTEGSVAEHSWTKATYTSPKTCSSCGATEGNPLEIPGKENYHGHVYTGGDSSTKYHYEENCAGKYSHEITWDEVERRNLGPCGTCVLK